MVDKIVATFIPLNLFSRKEARARRILEKIVLDPDYGLNAEERSLIEKARLSQDLERFREDARRGLAEPFARFNAIRTVGDRAVWSIGFSAAGSALFGGRSASVEGSIDPDNPKGMSNLDDRVELLFLSPLPNTAIRIGGVVYQYAAPEVKRMSLQQFLRLSGFEADGGPNHTRVELRLSSDERERLRNYLDSDVGDVAPLVFPFMNSVSQVNGVVSLATGVNVPWVADRSKAMTLAYLKLRKLLGDPKIGEITRATEKTENPALSHALSLGTDTLDSVLFLKNAGILLLVSPLLERPDTIPDTIYDP